MNASSRETIETRWSDEIGVEIRKERFVFGNEAHEQVSCFTRDGYLIGSLDFANDLLVSRRIVPEAPLRTGDMSAADIYLLVEEPDPEGPYCLVPPPGLVEDTDVTPAVLGPMTLEKADAMVKEDEGEGPFADWLIFPFFMAPIMDDEAERAMPCCTGVDHEGTLWAWRETPTGAEFRSYRGAPEDLGDRRALAYRWLSGQDQAAMAAQSPIAEPRP